MDKNAREKPYGDGGLVRGRQHLLVLAHACMDHTVGTAMKRSIVLTLTISLG